MVHEKKEEEAVMDMLNEWERERKEKDEKQSSVCFALCI